MTTDELIAHGNYHREQNDPEQALACYAQAFVQDRTCIHAFNNYGNVLREVGDAEGAIPFLQRAIALDPTNTTAQFNLAVAYLLAGDLDRGWTQYEHRWNFEHLAGTLPTHTQPRWTGEDLKDKTILVVGEQGHGDNIQFARFAINLIQQGARVLLQVNDNVGALFRNSQNLQVVDPSGELPEFDYWTPIMSIPRILKINYDNLERVHRYLVPDAGLYKQWLSMLGPKKKLRVGFCWSGRRDSWINRHKAMPQEIMLDLIGRNPNYDWFNLQLDATAEETDKLRDAGVVEYPAIVKTFADTAALMSTLDVVVTVDTAVAHLGGALGVPTWVMLNQYALDWRWLLDRDSSPWYSTARLFRQPSRGDWRTVSDRVHQYLGWFKV